MKPEKQNESKHIHSDDGQKWKFNEITADPLVHEKWEKVRQFFFLRESTYDMTGRCNIRCEGCYYYEGEKQLTKENQDPTKWRELMKKERARGINYTVLAGAEPSLVPELLEVCSQEIPLGCIATNGLKPIPQSVGYKIHISVWGNDETSQRTRNARHMLKKQIENYTHDPRAVFVYTFTRHNIDEVYEVADILVENNCKLTFNMFSAPVGYTGVLKHNEESLLHTRKAMLTLLAEYPENILFSYYNAIAHTHQHGLHKLFTCPYPRINPSTDIGLGRSFRQYRTDLTWNRDTSCCVPDTDCEDCRHYAAGSAIVPARLFRHAVNPDIFKAWLDYVDTYLAVWIMEYEKGKNLCHHTIQPSVSAKVHRN